MMNDCFWKRLFGTNADRIKTCLFLSKEPCLFHFKWHSFCGCRESLRIELKWPFQNTIAPYSMEFSFYLPLEVLLFSLARVPVERELSLATASMRRMVVRRLKKPGYYDSFHRD